MSKRFISRLSIILLSSLMVIQSCQTPNNVHSNNSVVSNNKLFNIKAGTCTTGNGSGASWSTNGMTFTQKAFQDGGYCNCSVDSETTATLSAPLALGSSVSFNGTTKLVIDYGGGCINTSNAPVSGTITVGSDGVIQGYFSPNPVLYTTSGNCFDVTSVITFSSFSGSMICPSPSPTPSPTITPTPIITPTPNPTSTPEPTNSPDPNCESEKQGFSINSLDDKISELENEIEDLNSYLDYMGIMSSQFGDITTDLENFSNLHNSDSNINNIISESDKLILDTNSFINFLIQESEQNGFSVKGNFDQNKFPSYGSLRIRGEGEINPYRMDIYQNLSKLQVSQRRYNESLSNYQKGLERNLSKKELDSLRKSVESSRSDLKNQIKQSKDSEQKVRNNTEKNINNSIDNKQKLIDIKKCPSKKSGKEKANDIPLWSKDYVKSVQRDYSDLNPNQQTEKVFELAGRPITNTGPSSEYNKIKKWFSRN